MKKLCLLSVLFLCLTLPLFAQDSKQITAEGVASVGNDPAAARDKAIEDALRRAVEQAVGTIVESETAVENYQLLSDKIYSHSSGYVKDYKVVSEKTEGGLVRVTVAANVSSGELNNDLSAIGLLQRRMKYPRVMVMIVEQNILNSETYWNQYVHSGSQAEASIVKKLKEKGFNVVDSQVQRRQVVPADAHAAWEGNYETAGNIGTKFGAEIVIVGEATSTRAENTIMGSDLISVSSALNASAVKSGTGEVIAQAQTSGTAAHINEVAATQQSLVKAADQAGDQLIDGILETWKKESSGTRQLLVQIDDINPSEVDKVKATLGKMRGVTEVIVRNISNGSADINIESKTDAQDLSDVIGKSSFPGFHLVLVDSSVDHLQYRVVH